MNHRVSLAARIRHLVTEIHRRSLWQVLAVYGVASWMAYEVILSLTDGLGLPGWVPGLAVAIFFSGLPIVVAAAFVQEAPLAAGDAAEATVPEAQRDVPGRESAHGSPHPLTWRRVLLGAAGTMVVLAALTGLFMAMRVLGIGPPGTLVAKGMLDAREPLVVAEFDGLTGDSALALVVAEGLRADLAQSSFVTTADRARVRETLGLMLRPPDTRLDAATAREVAIRMGLKAVIEGEVGRAGAGYLITARVVTADSARTLAAFRETAADSTQLLEAIERLSRSLRERVGESLKDVRASAPLQQVTTASLPALRKAAEGWREEARQNRERAIRLMNEAVELDAGFSSAWAGLAIMHYNRGDRAATLGAIRKALEHEDRLSELQRHGTRGLYATFVGDLATAEREQREVAALSPGDPRPHVLLSDLLWNRGHWSAAEAQATLALEMGATGWVPHWNLLVAILDEGDLDRAEVAARRAMDVLPPGDDVARQLRDMVLSNRAAYDSVHTLNADRPYRAALADRVLGRWSEAESHLLQVGDSVGARSWAAAARLLVLDDTGPGEWLEQLGLDPRLLESTPERRILEHGLIMAMIGRPDAARGSLEAYLARVPPEIRWGDAFLLHAIDAFLALHQGRSEAAIATLQEARASTPWTAPVDAFLGRAYEALERPDSAIAAYTRYVESSWSDRLGFFNTFSDPLLLVPTHERLAYLHHGAGEPDAASRHARAVLRLWRDADPELRSRVRAMQRHLTPGSSGAEIGSEARDELPDALAPMAIDTGSEP